MSQVLTVTAAKARLSELVAGVSTTHDHVEITRNGEPAAVLMSFSELEALRETIAILADREAAAQIIEAEVDIAAGRLTDLDDMHDIMAERRHQPGA
jgi:prevent-host-death family protein